MAEVVVTFTGLPEGSTLTTEGNSIRISVPDTPVEPPIEPPIEPPEPEGDYLQPTLKSRTDLELMVSVKASAPPKYVIVENGTYAWRTQPKEVPAQGDTKITLTKPTDFTKFLLDGCPAVDVPSAQDAANYQPSGGSGGGGTDPKPEPPIAGAPTAASIRARMKRGPNIERGRPFLHFNWHTAEGNKYISDYLKSLGLNMVRIFYPYRPGGGWWDGSYRPMLDTEIGKPTTDAQVQRLVDVAKHFTQNKIIVLYDCLDVCSYDRDFGQYRDLCIDHVKRSARLIKQAAIDPHYIVVGAINEHEASDNATWNPIRMAMLDLLDKELPGYVLSTGGANWKDQDHLNKPDYQIWPKRPTFHDVHNYYDIGWNYEWLRDRLVGWQKAHGDAPVYYGELGPGHGGQGMNAEVWEATMKKQLAGFGTAIPVLPWTITDQGAWLLNQGNGKFWNGSQGWDPNIEGTIRW